MDDGLIILLVAGVLYGIVKYRTKKNGVNT